MTNKKTEAPGEARQLFSVFLLVYAIHCVEQTYFIYGNVLESYGFSPQMTGKALGSFFIAIMAARPVGSWMIENLGIRRSLIWGGAMALAGCSVLFFTRSVIGIYAGRILSGLAFGVFTLGIYSYQALVTKPEQRGKFFALTMPGGVLPMATITPLGEWLFMGGHVKSYLALGPIVGAACLFLGMRTASDSTSRRPD
ncbi:MAG: MFS transporter, partial [Synergistaceae bacterium]|nr:MFS transporter [Synergistaceae bacterium]